MPPFRLYLITDRRLVPSLPEAVDRALSSIPRGAAAVQLREKDLSARDLLALGRRLLPITRRHRAPLLVNDRLDVALALGAEGVHLTSGSVPVREARRLFPSGWIGASCHGPEELRAREGADFATFSPIFPSPGKGPALGIDALREAATRGPTPLFALGGIDPSNVPAALRAGAHGIAAIRSWLEGDPAVGARATWEALSTSGPSST